MKKSEIIRSLQAERAELQAEVKALRASLQAAQAAANTAQLEQRVANLEQRVRGLTQAQAGLRGDLNRAPWAAKDQAAGAAAAQSGGPQPVTAKDVN